MTDKTRPTIQQLALKTPTGWLAFGFGSGLSAFAPGTMGTLMAIPFAIFLKQLSQPWYWLMLIVTFAIGVWVCDLVSRRLGVHDHGGIVWDEMVGYWLAIALVPLQWQWLLAGFVLFRIFDILKPWPINVLDKKVSGGFGIMIDDILAAVYALLIMAAVQYFV